MVKVVRADTGDIVNVDVPADLSTSELRKEIGKRFGASNQFGNNVIVDSKQGVVWVFPDDMSKGTEFPPRFTQPEALDVLVDAIDLSVSASWDTQRKLTAYANHVEFMRTINSIAQQRVDQARSSLIQSMRQQTALTTRVEKLQEMVTELQTQQANLNAILHPLLKTVEACDTAQLTKRLAPCFVNDERSTLFDYLQTPDLHEALRRLSSLLVFVKNNTALLPSEIQKLRHETDAAKFATSAVINAAANMDYAVRGIQLADQQAAIVLRHEQLLENMKTSLCVDTDENTANMLHKVSSLDYMLEWNNSNWMEELRNNDELLREEVWKCSEAKYAFASKLYDWTASLAKLETVISTLISKVTVYKDLIGKSDFSKIQAAQVLPRAYSCSLRETLRRREFKQQLVADIMKINTTLQQRIEHEIELRKAFCEEHPLGERVVGSLFPGLFDARLPHLQVQFTNFDTELPAIEPQELEADTWEVLDQDDYRAVMNRNVDNDDNSVMLSSASFGGVTASVRQALEAAVADHVSDNKGLTHLDDDFSDSEESVDVAECSEDVSARLKQQMDEQRSFYEDRIRDLERQLEMSTNFVATSLSARHNDAPFEVLLSPKVSEKDGSDASLDGFDDGASSLTPLPEDRESLLQREKDRLESEIANNQHIIESLNHELESLKQDLELAEAEKFGMEEKVRLSDCSLEETKKQLESVIESYEAQLATLKQQYNELRADHNELITANQEQEEIMNARHRELQVLSARLEETKDSLDKATADLLTAEDENKQHHTTIADLERDLKELQIKCECLQKTNLSLKEHIVQLTGSLEDTTSRMDTSRSHYEEQAADLEDKVQQLTASVAKLQETVAALTAERDAKEAENTELQNRVDELVSENDKKNSENSSLIARLGEFASKCANVGAANDELSSMVAELNDEKSELHNELTTLNELHANLTAAKELIEKELSELQTAFSEQRTKLEYTERLHGDKQLQLQFTQEEFTKLKRSYQQEAAASQAVIDELKKKQEDVEGELVHAKQLLAEKEQGNKEVSEDLEAALELLNACEERYNNLDNELKEAQRNAERIEQQYQIEISEMVERYNVMVEDLEAKVRQLETQLAEVRATYDTDRKNWDDKHNELCETHRMEIAELESRIDDMKERITAADETKAQLQAMLKSTATELSAKTEQNLVLNHTIKAMTESAKAAQAKIDALQAQITIGEARLIEIETENTELNERLTAEQTQCAAQQTTIEKLTCELATATDACRVQQERASIMQVQLGNMESERNKLQEELDAKIEALEIQERENDGLTLTTKQMTEAAKTWSHTREELEGEIAELKNSLKSKDDAIEEVQRELAASEETIRQLREKLQEERDAFDAVVGEFRDLEQEKQNIAQELAATKKDYAAQQSQCREHQAVLSALQEELESKAEEMLYQRNVNSELKQKLSDTKQADTLAQTQIKDLSTKLANALNSISNLEAKLEQKQAELSKKEAACNTLNQTMKDLIARFRQTAAANNVGISTPTSPSTPQVFAAASNISAELNNLRNELEAVKLRAKQTEDQLHHSALQAGIHRQSLNVCFEVLSEIASNTENFGVISGLEEVRQGRRVLAKDDIAVLVASVNRLIADINELRIRIENAEAAEQQASIATQNFKVEDMALFRRVGDTRWEALRSSTEGPLYFLSEESAFVVQRNAGQFVYGKILLLTQHTANHEFNPFQLPHGTEFVTVDLIPEFEMN